MPEGERGDCWWLVLPDGTPIRGDRGGVVALFAELRVTRRPARVLHSLRAAPVLDALDRLAARNRAFLGRLVPDGPAPRRFP